MDTLKWALVGVLGFGTAASAQTGGLVGYGSFTAQTESVVIDTRYAASVVIDVRSTDWTGDTLTIQACADTEDTANCSWFTIAGTTLGASPTAATTITTANTQVRVTNYGYRAVRIYGTTVDGSPTITVRAYRGSGS